MCFNLTWHQSLYFPHVQKVTRRSHIRLSTNALRMPRNVSPLGINIWLQKQSYLAFTKRSTRWNKCKKYVTSHTFIFIYEINKINTNFLFPFHSVLIFKFPRNICFIMQSAGKHVLVHIPLIRHTSSCEKQGCVKYYKISLRELHISSE